MKPTLGDHEGCGPADLDVRTVKGATWYRCTRCGFVFNTLGRSRSAIDTALRAYGKVAR